MRELTIIIFNNINNFHKLKIKIFFKKITQARKKIDKDNIAKIHKTALFVKQQLKI